jgi:hypothetical protein
MNLNMWGAQGPQVMEFLATSPAMKLDRLEILNPPQLDERVVEPLLPPKELLYQAARQIVFDSYPSKMYEAWCHEQWDDMDC